MNVILLERIVNLGDLGEEVVVKSGFARNFLIPKGKAVRASKDNRAVFEARRAELERVAQERLGEAQGRGAKLQGLSVSISAKAGIQFLRCKPSKSWIPAFAGMTSICSSSA